MNKYSTVGLVLLGIAVGPNASLAGGISVPGDFPGSFSMSLLSGNLYWDFYGNQPCSWNCQGYTLSIDTTAKEILFDASAFDYAAPGIGAGTSQLTLNPISDWHIGSGTFWNMEASFYVDGSGVGTLTDTAGSTAGHWSLEVPVYATWNNTRFDFANLVLSTDASYNYYDLWGTEHTLSGVIMDYSSGDAFLVGQSIITDPSHPFYGIRMTLGFHGNDPVLSAVPVPAAAWLFGSGILALMGLGRRRAGQRFKQ